MRENTTFDWTGTSLQWRRMRGTLFKCQWSVTDLNYMPDIITLQCGFEVLGHLPWSYWKWPASSPATTRLIPKSFNLHGWGGGRVILQHYKMKTLFQQLYDWIIVSLFWLPVQGFPNYFFRPRLILAWVVPGERVTLHTEPSRPRELFIVANFI